MGSDHSRARSPGGCVLYLCPLSGAAYALQRPVWPETDPGRLWHLHHSAEDASVPQEPQPLYHQPSPCHLSRACPLPAPAPALGEHLRLSPHSPDCKRPKAGMRAGHLAEGGVPDGEATAIQSPWSWPQTPLSQLPGQPLQLRAGHRQMNPVCHLQPKVPPKPRRAHFGCGSAAPAHSPGPSTSGRRGCSAHLVADHHVDAGGTLPVHPMDVLRGDAVQVGDLLDQLQGGQLLQEDGVVHCRAVDRAFYRTSGCLQRSPPTLLTPQTSNVLIRMSTPRWTRGFWLYWGRIWKSQGSLSAQHQLTRFQAPFCIPVSFSLGGLV